MYRENIPDFIDRLAVYVYNTYSANITQGRGHIWVWKSYPWLAAGLRIEDVEDFDEKAIKFVNKKLKDFGFI